MFRHFLLLMTVLGPGTSLQPWDTRKHGTKEASDPVHLRGRRQADWGDDLEDLDDYPWGGTEPPEMLINVTNTAVAHPEALTRTAVLEQTDSREAASRESATAKVAATRPVGPDGGGRTLGLLSTESDTQWKPTQPAPTEAETSQPAPTEAETTQPAPTEAETTQPGPTEAETSQPAPTEAETSQPAPTEAETTQPGPTEAETTQPAPTEAETTQPGPTEAETIQPAPTEAETTQPALTETTELPRIQFVKTLFTKSTATEAPSTEPDATETMSTKSNDSVVFLGPSVPHNDNEVSTGHFSDVGMKKGLVVTPASSVAPAQPGTSDLIPVKQCLLAILILAFLATVFLVCTVVLAVRLSRKNHMYPVRNYSPTEMICISSLLPEGGEGPPAAANGGLPKAGDLKTEPSEARDGDDLTLHSFLP
ncbi:LOW QUALITY PROTEIN: P-selectin glycoprotein ligand 1 [Acomys russatus]|uniref:LOW QUALITY PROTEIN: P-selectin glycoprotein ligand 1 n=1 Tax=Acomys russatus TaxID=60746 RepID=UPI0021E2BDE0|nr:LOW QUALITY PROTEIN: P-selectin glycoprotein ligand 1 [Acomys russatus]